MKRLNFFFWFFIVLITFFAISARLYKIDNSITEWFSWRQADTAAVGKLFLEKEFNLLKPRYFDLSPIQSGKLNPEGYRMVEFPLYSGIFAGLTKAWPILPLEMWARITTITFSLFMIWAIYYLLFAELGLIEAVFGGLFLSLAPFSVFYSRAILPDMMAISLSILAIFFSYLYSKKKLIALFIFGIVFFALALLVKPTVIFFIIPIIYYLYLSVSKSYFKKALLIFVFLFISIIPFVLWRIYITQFPEGIPASQWLFTSVNTATGLQVIFFRPAFFRWVFFERINGLILGGFLSTFLVLGLFNTGNKNNNFLALSFFLSGILYLFTFQGGNVQHEYYQILILPTLAVLIGAGVGYFVRDKKKNIRNFKIIIVIVIFIFSLLFSFYKIKGNYDETRDYLSFAEIIKSFTKRNDLIVTDSEGDTTVLYLADREGYPAPFNDFPSLINKGAKYFATMNHDYKNKLKGQYTLVFEDTKFLLFKL